MEFYFDVKGFGFDDVFFNTLCKLFLGVMHYKYKRR